MLAFAVAAAVVIQAAPPAAAQPVAPLTAADQAATDIARLEQQWGEAFVKRDFDFIERIVAPEYRLVGADADRYDITRRAEWMANARAFTHHAFEVKTVDVNVAGDIAVASAKGLWTVGFRPGMPPVRIHFFVTDTWVRRGGQWQVIHRYSHRLNQVPPRPASAS